MDAYSTILKLAEAWQNAIITDWKQQDLIRKNTLTEVRTAAFNWLAILISLYWAEGRQLILPGRLQALRNETDTCEQLAFLWDEFCHQYGRNSRLKRFHFSNALRLKSKLIQVIIDSLYCSKFEQSQLSINILGMLYEASLSFSDSYLSSVFESSRQAQKNQHINKFKYINKFKKSNGVYYTPQSVVQFVVKQTIDCYFEHSHGHCPDYLLPQILDPTCGGGAFLLTAYQHLLDRCLEYQFSVCDSASNPALQRNRYDQLQLSFNERRRILYAIHGVDLDPQAVIVTQVSLWLKLIENLSSFDHSSSVFASTSVNDISIHCGNALAVLNHQQIDSFNLDFCWQTAFPNHIPAGFDIVVGNPPYIDAEQMTANLPAWRSYCSTHYQTATGNWDLFCIFIEKALQLCRVGGFTSLVVPNKLLSADYASAARQLLSCSRLISIRDYSQVAVFEASVYPIVYVSQKVAPRLKLTSPDVVQNTTYERMQTLDQVGETYATSLHSRAETAQPWLVGHRTTVTLMQQLEQFPKLEKIAQVVGAATVAEAYLLKDLIQENATPAVTDFRLVNSGIIDRYLMRWGKKPLRYLKQAYYYPVVSEASLTGLSKKRLAQAKQAKIIVAGMSRRLEGAFDATGSILAGKSTSIVLPPIEASIDMRYLLALLNSRLASFYILNYFQGNRLQGGYLRIGAPQLRQIPIVLPQPDQQNWYKQIVDLVEYRLSVMGYQHPLTLHQELQAIDQEIDALVYAIYHLKDTEIEIVVNDPQLLTIHS